MLFFPTVSYLSFKSQLKYLHSRKCAQKPRLSNYVCSTKYQHACTHTGPWALHSGGNPQEAGFSDSLERNATAQAHLQTRKPQRGPEAGPRPPRVPAQRSQLPYLGQPLWQQTLGGSRASENNRNQCLGVVLQWLNRHTGDKDNTHCGSKPQKALESDPSSPPCRGSTRNYPVDTVRPQ